MTCRAASLIFLLAAACACRAPAPGAGAFPLPDRAADRAGVEACLDAWHRAASQADGAGYFGRMSEDAAFLGTDESERWSREAFAAYAEPYFSVGRGWTYAPSERHVAFGEGGRVAWIDERLSNEKYGSLRGTGVLRRDPEGWRIVHYSMSFPVPNELSSEVVALIRAGRD